MKSGWKDMYFAKPKRPDKKIHDDTCHSIFEEKDARFAETRAKRLVTQRANANIGSNAEIAAYLAREPVARRYEYDEPKGMSDGPDHYERRHQGRSGPALARS
jgi:hypothetical protein